jgi:hypothetical protein
MKTLGLLSCCLAALATAATGADDFLDQLDDALTVAADHDQIRARVSGSADLEGYYFQQPAPTLIYTDKSTLLNPRLTLFLDVQAGAHVYFFAQSRLDRGYNLGEGREQLQLDEYALRLTPWDNGRLNLQLGKFATVVGNWVPRHHSWDNPFITAPLPYENLTGIFDGAAANSAATLLRWAQVRPDPNGGEGYYNQYRVPIIWGPSYTSGAAVTGAWDKFDYALEFKNASLSSRPDTWDAGQTQWQHPTWSGRLGYRPDESWSLGFSASTGSYLTPSAQPTLAAGYGLGDYREVVLGQDLGFAWHHLQLWAEFFETNFQIPAVGNARTFAYYLEAKYKFTPQFFGALRWNQQLYGSVPDGAGGHVRWGRNLWRIDVAPGYRFTPHTQFKLQYSLQAEDTGPRTYTSLIAAQFVLRF